MTLKEFLVPFIALVIYLLAIYFVPLLGIFLGAVGIYFMIAVLFFDDVY